VRQHGILEPEIEIEEHASRAPPIGEAAAAARAACGVRNLGPRRELHKAGYSRLTKALRLNRLYRSGEQVGPCRNVPASAAGGAHAAVMRAIAMAAMPAMPAD